MSRKDIMKKSLGIPEYPWSSDDELDEVIAPVEASTRRPTESRPSTAEGSGTSSNAGGSSNPVQPRPQSGNHAGTQPSRNQPSRTHQSGAASSRSQHSGTSQPSGSRLSGTAQSGSRLSGTQPHETRRNQERIDEDLYWTILNAPHIVNSSTGSREPYNELPAFLSRVSHTPAQELRERGERPTVSDMQRILAFKRLTRNLASTSLRRGPVTGLIPVSRVNPGIVVPSEATSSIRIGRMVPRRRYYRSPPSGSGSGSARTGGSLSPRSSRSRREHEPSTPRPAIPLDEGEAQRPIPTQNISGEANPEQEENLEGDAPSLETSADTISLDEPELEGSAADISDPQDVSPVEDAPVTEDICPSDYPTPVTDPNLASVGQTVEMDLPPPQTTNPAKRKRRDSDDNTEPCTVKEFNQSLLRLLECPVCLEWMEPPMSQCRRGHLVCGRCRARLNCCPVCRTAFSSVRNRAMEGVAEMVRYPCRHGCGREVRLRRRAPHEASCAARKYLCPAPLCANSNPLPRTDLHLHFQSPKQEGDTNEGLSEVKETEEEKTLLYPDIRRGQSILEQLLSGHGTNERLTRDLLIRRSFVSEELSKQLVPGLQGGRPPPENENSAPANQPLGPGRPYLEALRRLAVNIANEPAGGAAPAQGNPANPGAPQYFPPARPPYPMAPHVVGPRNMPPNAGPNYFLGMPEFPLPYGVRHSIPIGEQNVFLPEPQPDLVQRALDVLHHGNGSNNGAQSKHLPMIKIGRLHKFSMKVNIEQHDNWLIFAMDEYFHLRIDVDIRTWGVVVYVSYIGPKCDAKNYTYAVTVDGQHNSRKITYTRATHSDLESSSLNVTRQDCFHLTLDQALNFIRFKNRHCDTDKFLDFNLEIAKVEPTTPRDESDS